MVAVARKLKPKTAVQGYGVTQEARERLAELADYVSRSSSQALSQLLTLAEGEILLERPWQQNRLFAKRLRELAASESHPAMEVRTSFSLTDEHIDAIRRLRDGLQLPRRDLVVEYVVQAAWETDKPRGGGNGDGGPGDPRRGALGSTSANLHPGSTSPAPLAPAPTRLPGQLALLEEDDSEG